MLGREFLRSAGYTNADLDGLLAQLACRLKTQPEFPREIGIFLRYPLRDVVGFIENRGQNFTCCGFWKSYGDPAETQACFDRYRRCIQTYVAMFEQGTPLSGWLYQLNREKRYFIAQGASLLKWHSASQREFDRSRLIRPLLECDFPIRS